MMGLTWQIAVCSILSHRFTVQYTVTLRQSGTKAGKGTRTLDCHPSDSEQLLACFVFHLLLLVDGVIAELQPTFGDILLYSSLTLDRTTRGTLEEESIARRPSQTVSVALELAGA